MFTSVLSGEKDRERERETPGDGQRQRPYRKHSVCRSFERSYWVSINFQCRSPPTTCYTRFAVPVSTKIAQLKRLIERSDLFCLYNKSNFLSFHYFTFSRGKCKIIVNHQPPVTQDLQSRFQQK